MQIGKKAALMAAAAGAMVIGTAGGASAYGVGPLFGSSGGVQSNSCDTHTGTTMLTGMAAPTGDQNIGSDCVNFTNSGASQINDCDTATGTTMLTGGAAPSGDVHIGSKCANVALQSSAHENKNKKSKKSNRRGHSY
ncbi:hypothetical protein B7755_021265 [Streptomyces sp. NBS 14/10]|uniref:hypothetical protein n=1 Tax=Streptomyces sp. NBS 14/10 TaxID=1945643 RepID=UPI00211AD97C|nr:hypothetical protein [Streptomyces sp. NBS 14/10]KAK1180451.1 hypothetical protein B7755_021265 [Streptomyces sp. NBS 14/10]